MDASIAYPDLDDHYLYSSCKDCENTNIDKSLPFPKREPLIFLITYDENRFNIRGVIIKLLPYNRLKPNLELGKGDVININDKFKITSKFYYDYPEYEKIHDSRNSLVLKVVIFGLNFCLISDYEKIWLDFFYLSNYDTYFKKSVDDRSAGSVPCYKTYNLEDDYVKYIIKILEVLIENKFFVSKLIIPSKSYFRDGELFEKFSHKLVEYVKGIDHVEILLRVVLKGKKTGKLEYGAKFVRNEGYDSTSYVVDLPRDNVEHFKDL